MASLHRWYPPLCALLAAATLARPAAAQPQDQALQVTERFLHRAVSSSMDAPLSAEAAQIFGLLRSSHDKDLLALFNRLRTSKSANNQVYAMIASAMLTKDSSLVDLKFILAQDQTLISNALVNLMDAELLSTDQLKLALAQDKDAGDRAMILGELARKKALADRSALPDLLKSSDNFKIRYNLAITMLTGDDPAQTAAALAALREMSDRHDLNQAPVQALMIIRAQRDQITAAIPWIAQVAGDEANDDGLRYTAVAALLTFKAPDGPAILAAMIQKQKEPVQQIKLGLLAVQYGRQLQPPAVDPLLKSRSPLVQSIARLALQSTQGADTTPGLLALLKEGHPIVLDWAFGYTDTLERDRQITVRMALVNQASIVDDVRDKDYERAAAAAQRLLDEDGPEGRQVVASLLKSDNRAVVEATLAGIYRSDAKDQAQLVLKIWDGLTRNTSSEAAANYAALILAREGHREPLNWLPGIIMGGTAQGPGFRALAGWYYAKLQNQSDALLKRALAD